MVRVRHVWPAVLLIAAATARSSPGATYWIDYDPRRGRFPEDPLEGWTRVWGYMQAQRWLENGQLVIDSRASVGIVDGFEMRRPGQTDPGPGETFVMEWRLRVAQVIGSADVGVSVFSDDKWGVGLKIGEDSIISLFEPGVHATFTPYVPHDFQLVSTDMRRYTLKIDGVPSLEGSFWLSLVPSLVGWGDGTQGAASLTYWSYFRFGVVPEPQAAVLILVSLCTPRGRRLARN